MPAIFEYSHVVTADDLDLLGHANNLSYLKWMQSAALAHSAAQGWPTDAYARLGSGWVVRSHRIEYLQPAFAGNVVVVRTWVADMKKVTSLRRYEIVRQGSRFQDQGSRSETAARDGDRVLLAKAATDWAFIHYSSGMPKRIPAEIAGAFEIVTEGNAECGIRSAE